MRISKLIKEQKKELVERFYSHLYRNSSFRASPMVLMNIIDEDTKYTLRTQKSRTTGFNLRQILEQQLQREKSNNSWLYEEISSRI